jgi:hypothetical protein
VSSFVKRTIRGSALHLQDVDLPPAASSQANNDIIEFDAFNAFSFSNGLQNFNSVPQSEVLMISCRILMLWILIKTGVGCGILIFK